MTKSLCLSHYQSSLEINFFIRWVILGTALHCSIFVGAYSKHERQHIWWEKGEGVVYASQYSRWMGEKMELTASIKAKYILLFSGGGGGIAGTTATNNALYLQKGTYTMATPRNTGWRRLNTHRDAMAMIRQYLLETDPPWMYGPGKTAVSNRITVIGKNYFLTNCQASLTHFPEFKGKLAAFTDLTTF